MPVVDRRNALSGIMVSEAMRRLVVQLPVSAPIEQAIRFTIKFKVNAMLIMDDSNHAMGVVSKTDLMGAYYADLPVDTPVEAVMVGPPLFCRPDDSLETALDAMRTNGIHRLYVSGDESDSVIGVLAYPDIVGLLYRFCHKCDRSIRRSGGADESGVMADRFRVGEVMTGPVQSSREDATLSEVMEELSTHRLGAVLVRRMDDLPIGVVSKSDLVVAYKHGIPQASTAGAAMSTPVHSCDANAPLANAISRMIFWDIHRLFVCREDPSNIVGVLSLTDAARVRSGSCRACMTSRIEARMVR